MLTEEEKLRIRAEYGLDDAQPAAMAGSPPMAPAPPMDAQRSAQIRAEYGLNDAPTSPQAPEPTPRQYQPPTLLNQALHVAKGLGRNMFDTEALPFNMEQLAFAGGKALGMGDGVPSDTQAFNVSEGSPLMQMMGPEMYGRMEERFAGDVVDPEQSRLADALRTVAEWTGPGALGRTALQGLQNLANRAIPDARQVTNVLADTGLKSDLAVGTAAAAGSQLGSSEFGRETLGLDDGEITEAGGGMTAALIASMLRRRPTNTEQAMNLVSGQATDPAAMRAAAQAAVLRDEAGTLADVTGDRGVTSLQQGMLRQNQNGTFDQGVREAGTQRVDQIAAGVLDEFGAETPVGAQGAATDFIDDAGAAIDRSAAARVASEADTAREIQANIAATEINPRRQAITEAVDAAEQADVTAAAAQSADDAARQVIEPDMPSYDQSKAMRDAATAAEEGFVTSVETPAWNDFKAGPSIPSTELRSGYDDIVSELGAMRGKKFEDAYGKDVLALEVWDDADVPPADVQVFLTDLREMAYDVADPIKGPTSEQRILRDVITKMEESITSPTFKRAKAATREKYDRFRGDTLVKAQKQQPEMYVKTLIGTTPEANAVAARELRTMNEPEVRDQVFEVLAQRASGGVDADFMRNYQPLLEELPAGLRQPFDNALASGGALRLSTEAAQAARTSAQATQKAGEAAIDEAVTRSDNALKRATQAAEKAMSTAQQRKTGLGKTRMAEFSANPGATIERLLKPKADPQDLTRLGEYMESAGQGDSFRGAVRDRLEQTFFRDSIDNVRANSTDMRQMRMTVARLRETNIIDADQADRIETMFKRTLSQEQRRDVIASYAAPDNSEFNNLLASIASAGVLQGVGGTQSLLLGGAVRRNVAKYLKGNKDYKQEHVQLLEEMMLNPSKYIQTLDNYEAVKRMTSADEIAAAMMKPFDNLGALGQTAAGLNEEDQE